MLKGLPFSNNLFTLENRVAILFHEFAICKNLFHRGNVVTIHFCAEKTRRDCGPMDFEWLSIVAKYLVPISLLGFGAAFMMYNYRKYASWLKDKLFADKTDN